MKYLEHKIILMPLLFVFLATSGFTTKYDSVSETEMEIMTNQIQFTSEESLNLPCYNYAETHSLSRECTISIQTDDIDIEVTLHDVSSWDCFKLKARAVWYKITGQL